MIRRKLALTFVMIASFIFISGQAIAQKPDVNMNTSKKTFCYKGADDCVYVAKSCQMRIDTYYSKDLETISFKEKGKKKITYLIIHTEPYEISGNSKLAHSIVLFCASADDAMDGHIKDSYQIEVMYNKSGKIEDVSIKDGFSTTIYFQ